MTNKSTDMGSSEPLFCLAGLEAMDDPEYTKEIIADFLRETPVQLDEMKKAFEKRSIVTIAKLAHKVKSSAAVLEASAFFSNLAAIENMSRDEKVPGELNGLIDGAYRHYQMLEVALKGYLRSF